MTTNGTKETAKGADVPNSASRENVSIDHWSELTPRQMEVLVAIARMVLEGTAPPTFRDLAGRLGIKHHIFSALHHKGYLVREGQRGPGVTLTGRAWLAIARAHGPWKEPPQLGAATSGESFLLQGARNSLRYLLEGGRPRSQDHAALRALSRYLGNEEPSPEAQ